MIKKSFRNKKHRTLKDTLTYVYIRKIKKWMLCPACKNGKMSIKNNSTLWQCEDCGYQLSADEFENDYIFWFCDECDAYLNIQEEFDKNNSSWICTDCGYKNDITFDNLKGICSDCGKIITDPDQTLCTDCRLVRKERAKDYLMTAGIVIGALASSAAYNTSHSYTDSSSNNLGFNPADDERNIRNGEFTMRCAYCGNTSEDTLWDEGDTIYCSICCHRTSTVTGEDDSVECPYCHRMRDRKAMYCRYCNDSTWCASTYDEFKEIDEMLKKEGY